MTLTPETLAEIRVAVGMLLGWEIPHKEKPYGLPPSAKGQAWAYIEPLPDFCHSLDAMAQAEQTLTDEEKIAYMNAIVDVCREDHPDPTKAGAMWLMITATALQRAIAFTRVRHVHNPKWEAGE